MLIKNVPCLCFHMIWISCYSGSKFCYLELYREKAQKKLVVTLPLASGNLYFAERFDNLCRSKVSLGQVSRNRWFSSSYMRAKFLKCSKKYEILRTLIFGQRCSNLTQISNNFCKSKVP
jgi:hypothetical protein